MQLKLRVRWEKDEIFSMSELSISCYVIIMKNLKWGYRIIRESSMQTILKLRQFNQKMNKTHLSFPTAYRDIKLKKKHKYDLRQNLKNI